jgi:hypothetical protein
MLREGLLLKLKVSLCELHISCVCSRPQQRGLGLLDRGEEALIALYCGEHSFGGFNGGRVSRDVGEMLFCLVNRCRSLLLK